MESRLVLWTRQLAKRVLAETLPTRILMVHGPRASASVCLTFDDGPHPELTPRVLDVLLERRTKATFFLLGREAERYPAITRRIAAEGHTIGSHSYSHPNRRLISSSQARDEVTNGAKAISGIVGTLPTLYRPPLGKLTPTDLWTLWKDGVTTVLWNIEPKRRATQTHRLELGSWFIDRHFKGGDLVLLHDVYPEILGVVPAVIDSILARNLQFSMLEAWVK